MKRILFSRMKSYQKVGMIVSVFTLTLLFFQNCNKLKSNLIDQSSVLDSKEYSDTYLNSSFAEGEKKYFGYYNYYHGASDYPQNGRYFDLQPIKDHSNVVFIHLNDPYYKARIAEAYQSGMGVVIDIGNLFYKTNHNPTVPDSEVSWYKDKTELSDNYLSEWSQLVEFLKPYRTRVVAFYDEEPYWSASYHIKNPSQQSIISALLKVNSNLGQIASTIESSYPEIPYAIMDEGLSFAGRFFVQGPHQPLQTCVSCRDVIRIPVNVDWIGFEGEYPENLEQYDNWEGFSVIDYMNFTKAKISSSHQKLAIAPPSFIAEPQTDQRYSEMKKVIDRFFDLALQEPKLIAVFPYFWYAPADQRNRVGLLDQSKSDLRDVYKNFGLCVLNQFQSEQCQKKIQSLPPPVITPPNPVTLPNPVALPSITAGLFTSLPSIYKSDGNYKYCGFTSMDHFLGFYPNQNVSSLTNYANVPSNMIYTGACPAWIPEPSISAGLFTSLPSIYKSDGNYKYCGYTSMEHFLAFYPNQNVSTLTNYASVPTNMIYSGACEQFSQPSIVAGAFKNNNNLYYSNGNYHYCSYRSLSHYFAEGNNSNTNAITQVLQIQNNMINDGVCGAQ